MTGTAVTEAAEFADIYKLEVVEIPTNVPVARIDDDDEVYRTAAEKYDARSSTLIEECRARASSRCWSARCRSRSRKRWLPSCSRSASIPHQVLNARYHEQEAHIVAQAGRPGAVTIATNMAGRGTDIQLGGNLEMRVAQRAAGIADEAGARAARERASRPKSPKRERRSSRAGGLFVIGTERHESRRIDNQLRGRSGRQGDPGASKFFLSLEDDLMRIFGSDRMDGVLQPARPEGRRGDRPSLDQQGAREGAEEGRGAQLRHPQEPAEVRRRDERPAQGDLSSSASRS